jgi:hypothetical protein
MFEPDTLGNFLSLTVVWSDIHALEIEIRLRFNSWSGAELAYTSRAQLNEFAGALDRVAAGATEAKIDIGLSTLGRASCRLFEYGRARRLGLEVAIGNGEVADHQLRARELRMSVPIEHGPLPSFASAIRSIVTAEKGTARLALLTQWP